MWCSILLLGHPQLGACNESHSSDHHQLLQVPEAVVPMAVLPSGGNTGEGSGEGTVIYCYITQDWTGENESGEGEWMTVHLWIVSSHAWDGGYVSIGAVHFGPSGSD